MIRRIREIAASLHDDLADDLLGRAAAGDSLEDDDDAALELLVKNAARDSWLEHDPRRVWKQLSERVRGPFGQIAVEQAANAGDAMPLAYETQESGEQTAEPSRYRFFLMSEGTLSQR